MMKYSKIVHHTVEGWYPVCGKAAVYKGALTRASSPRLSAGWRICGVILCLSIITVLAGCATPPPFAGSPNMTFDNFNEIDINVAKIEVRDDYKSPMKDPNVEYLFPTPPYAAAEALIKKQMVAVGHDNALRVIIDDASVVQEDLLPMKANLRDSFMPSKLLKARVLLRLEIFDPAAPDIVISHAEVTAKHDMTLLYGTSVADRDHAYFSLTEALMKDLSKGISTVVMGSLANKP